MDPIQNAIDSMKRKSSEDVVTLTTYLTDSNLPQNVINVKNLPNTRNPELLKQEANATAQKKLGDLQNKLYQEEEKRAEKLKEKVATLSSLSVGAVSLFEFQKVQQEVRELKQKVSKENLKKAKESFTFPIKPPTVFQETTRVPKVPDLPTFPNLPSTEK